MNGVELKPADWHKDVQECLLWCGRDRNWFSAQGFEKHGRDPTDGRRSLYDVRQVCLRAFSSPVVDDDGEVIDHDAEKARLTKARRIAQELDNAERELELRPVFEVSEAIVAALTPVVAMLDNLPVSIKRVCPALSQTGVEKMERAIAESRNELAGSPVLVGS